MKLSEDRAYDRESREDRGWEEPVAANANIKSACRSIR